VSPSDLQRQAASRWALPHISSYPYSYVCSGAYKIREVSIRHVAFTSKVTVVVGDAPSSDHASSIGCKASVVHTDRTDYVVELNTLLKLKQHDVVVEVFFVVWVVFVHYQALDSESSLRPLVQVFDRVCSDHDRNVISRQLYFTHKPAERIHRENVRFGICIANAETLVWLNGLVVSALGIRTRWPRFESRGTPLFHWVATLGIASPVSQLQETGVQKGVFGA